MPNSRLKILMTNMNYRSTVVGGGQGSLQVLAEGLAEQGHEVTVVSIGDSPHEETANGVRAIRLPVRNSYWPFDGQRHSAVDKALWHTRDLHNSRMAQDLAHIIDDFEPHLLHSNVMAGWSIAIWDVAQKRGIPVVHTLRDYYILCLRSERFKNGQQCQTTCLECIPFKEYRSRASRRVTAVVGNSNYILNAHLELGAFANTPIRRVVYNGFQPPSPLPQRSERAGRLRIGYLGRLAGEKGITILLKAVQNLPKDAIELLVAGSGDADFEQGLRSRYSSDNISFLGFTQPSALFPRIDALVVPSIWPEPLPRTAFEAFAFGVPVIGSDRGGIPETIEEGVTGFVFSPNGASALQHLLEGLVSRPDTLASMRPAVLERSLDFTPRRVVKEYAGIYREALGTAGTG